MDWAWAARLALSGEGLVGVMWGRGRRRTAPAVDEGLEMGAELKLSLVLAFLVLGALRLGGVELLEVSCIIAVSVLLLHWTREEKRGRTFVVVEALVVLVHDIGRDGVEESSVVRNDEEGTGPGLEVVLQPGESVKIQVVRRL